MKKGFKVLCILSAIVMGATVCFTGCGKGEVAEHDHVWNNGEITTEPTCQKEGVKTYTCTVEGCGQTKTEPVGKTAHNWDSGEETKAPKCDAEGEKTYKCTNEGCKATKTEPIDKIDHVWDEGTVKLTPDFYTKGIIEYGCQNCTATKKENIPAGADFNLQFREEGEGEWSYGSAVDFNEDTGAFTYSPATADKGVWKADGIEITNGAVSVSNGKTAAIGYTFKSEVPEKIEALADITFVDGVSAYLVSTAGGSKSVEELADGKITSEPVAVQKGDQFILILKNEGAAAVTGELSFTVKSPCIHLWSDQGKVTKEATCTTRGETTYKCINCDAEIVKEDIPMSGHKIESSFTAPTLTKEGKLHYECSVCHGEDTKRDETLPKQENFAYDFEINNNGEFNGWQVGRVNYKFEDETFEFTKIQEHSAEAYTDNTNEQWKEIKNNWMAVNGMMGFAYKIPAGTPAKVNFRFELNAVADGEFTIRWAVKDKDGAVKNEGGKPKFVNGDSRSSYYFVEHIDVAENDILYVLVNHEDKGDQCTFNLALTPYVEFAGANFHDDFERNDQGVFKGWQVGTVNYHFPENDPEHPETFDFTKITAANNGGDGYFDNTNGWKEIKNNFMAVNGMMGFAYAFENDYSGSFSLHLERALSDGNFSVRMAVKDSKGNIKTNGGKAIWLGEAKDNNSFDINKAISVYGGDTLYILVNHDDDKGDQCTFTLTIATNGVQQQPAGPTETEIANFVEDFTTEASGAWKYGYIEDGGYDWGNNTFTFHELTADTNEQAWKVDNDKEKIEVKKDLFIMDKGYAAIGYEVGAGYTSLKVSVGYALNEDPNSRFTTRILVFGEDGALKFVKFREEGKTNAEWTVDETVSVTEGDTIYVVMFHEVGWMQGKLQITISGEKAQQPGAAFEGANFAEDFHGSDVTDSNWQYGHVDYHFSSDSGTGDIIVDGSKGETFRFTEAAYNGSEAWTADGVEIKQGWIPRIIGRQ